MCRGRRQHASRDASRRAPTINGACASGPTRAGRASPKAEPGRRRRPRRRAAVPPWHLPDPYARATHGWGDLDLPSLTKTIKALTLKDDSPAPGSTNSTAAAVLRRLFAWAREERIITVNPALELRTGWGASMRRKVLIPSIPQALRLARTALPRLPGVCSCDW